jgi:integrase
MWALALRKKEAIMLRPHLCVVTFGATGLPPEKKKAASYLRVEPGSKGGRERFVPLDTPERVAAIEHAQSVVTTRDGHMGHPLGTLKQNMNRFENVMKKFGITKNGLGVTSHGLRHEALLKQYETIAGEAAPIRGGPRPPKAIERLARQECADLAGHAKKRAAASYLGSVRRRTPQHNGGATTEPHDDAAASAAGAVDEEIPTTPA